MASELYIREATLNDIGHISTISESTFKDKYASVNTKQNIDDYVLKVFSLENTREDLMDPHNLFHLAYYENELVGYTKMRRSENPKEILSTACIEIERIYVIREFQGKKIGKALLQNCIQYATSKNWELIWLGVWEKNIEAIAFYKSQGFQFFGAKNFKLGSDIQNDFLMKKLLK